MRRIWMGLAGAVLAVVASGMLARSASIPLFTGPACSEPSQTLACLNQIITQYNTQLAAVPTPQTPRNVLDNGAVQVQQRGTGAATCALNGAAITSAAYSADRWGCQVNVGSGAGQLTVITATPSPPPGFQASMKQVRNSGALTQPQCTYQEVPTYKAVQLQGQQVTFSVYIQALAGLAADQGTNSQTANLLIITGTGTDQGFGTWTASPALTPAWTNVATAVNQSVALPATPAWTRYSATAAIGTTVTEIAVAICWTPTASGQSATDGIAFTGMQLEQGSVVTAYEFKTPAAETLEAQRYYWQLADNVASTVRLGLCQATTTTVGICVLNNPVTMRATPTVAVAAATSFGITVAAGTAGTCTTLATVSTSGTPNTTVLSCTTGSTLAAGNAAQFIGANTGAANTVTISADF